MQNLISLDFALRRKSYSVAIRIAVGLFLFISLFLFYAQIVQKRNLVEEKIKIDSELLVSSLKIGDLFFITRYVSSFVDSKSTPFVGIKDTDTDQWIFAYPAGDGKQIESGRVNIGLRQIHIFVPIDLSSQGKVQWRLYYVLEVANRLLINAFVISTILCCLIFLFLRNTLAKTSNYFTAPISHLIADLESQNDITTGNLPLEKYNEGQKFLETNQLVDALRSLIAKIEHQQEEIKKGEVLKALNRLSRQVSHDIQSPIGALKVAIKNFENNPAASKGLIVKSMERIEAIVGDLKIKDIVEMEKINVRKKVNLVEFIADLIKEKLSEYSLDHSNINFEFEQNILEREIRQGQFSRALSNIINNGIEACGDRKPELQISLGQVNGKILIAISDNGIGFPDHVMEKVFEHGFSHGKEKGSGMGLTYAKEVIENHGGNLKIISSRSVGSTIEIKF